MNLNRVCAGSVLALYCVAHARINTLSTLHLVRGVALQSIVNSLYFDAVLKEAKHKNPKKFLAVGLFLNAALAMTLHSRVNRAVACLFSIIAIYKTYKSQETSKSLTPLESQETSQAPTLLENSDLLEMIVKEVPFNERGKLGLVAKAWNAAIGEDPKLFNRSMNTLLTIMNDPAIDQRLRIRAAKALGLIRDPSSVAPLTAIINDPANNPVLRIFAAVALGRIGDSSAGAHLIAIINDPAIDLNLRVQAGEELLKMVGRASAEPLMAVPLIAIAIAPEIHERLRIRAREVLGRTGHPSSAGNLIGIMNDPEIHQSMRIDAAVEVLARTGHPSSVAFLKANMNDPENDLKERLRAAEVLGRIGDPSSVAPLTAIMNDPAIDQRLRMRAANGLGECRDSSALQPLTVMMDTELAPPLLRCHATAALAILLRRLNTRD